MRVMYVMLSDVDASTPAYVMLLCVCLARVWLWAFDLAHTQAMQVRVERASKRSIHKWQMKDDLNI